MTTSNAVDISDLYLDLHDSNDEGATVAVHGRRGADGVLAETLDGEAAHVPVTSLKVSQLVVLTPAES